VHVLKVSETRLITIDSEVVGVSEVFLYKAGPLLADLTNLLFTVSVPHLHGRHTTRCNGGGDDIESLPFPLSLSLFTSTAVPRLFLHPSHPPFKSRSFHFWSGAQPDS